MVLIHRWQKASGNRGVQGSQTCSECACNKISRYSEGVRVRGHTGEATRAIWWFLTAPVGLGAGGHVWECVRAFRLESWHQP